MASRFTLSLLPSLHPLIYFRCLHQKTLRAALIDLLGNMSKFFTKNDFMLAIATMQCYYVVLSVFL